MLCPLQNADMSQQYRVGILCALPIEHAAVLTLLDETHPRIIPLDDDNVYTVGRIASHNVVVTCLPAGVMGKVAASTTAANMKRSFPIEILLMVGIAGGLPPDVRLGDVVVSVPGPHGAVVQYDLMKNLPTGQKIISTLNKPPTALLNAVQALRSHHLVHEDKLQEHLKGFSPRFARPTKDLMFESGYEHPGDTCDDCDYSKLRNRTPRDAPLIHYGTIASGDQVIKYSIQRDRIAQETGAICFEMEAAALMDNHPCLVIRGICDYADSHKSKDWQPFAAAVAAAYAKELLASMPSRSAPTDVPSKGLSDFSKILESLYFPSMGFRRVNIEAAYGNTCRWLFEEERYKAWLTMSSDHFFWIKGKPGAGKSTLMNFAVSHSPKGHSTRISFFFNARGQQLDRSVLGMYRALLHQLISQVSRSWILPAEVSPIEDWSLGHLKTALRLVISNYPRPVQCFVDALDECTVTEAQDMIYFLQDLTRATRLYVCFASRFYPAVTIKNAVGFVLNNKNHEQDIEEYVRGRLDAAHTRQGEDLIHQLLLKANGVFFWAELVVKLLNKELSCGNLHNIQKTLASLPVELHDLLHEIVTKEPDELFISSLQWLLCSNTLLHPQEYHRAVMFTLYELGVANHSDVHVAQLSQLNTQQLRKFVQSSSRGLAEVVGVTLAKSTVQFVHESVPDFLRTGVALKLLTLDSNISNVHEHLKRASMQWLAAHDGLCHRAIEHAIHHANAAASVIAQDGFLKAISLDPVLRLVADRDYPESAILSMLSEPIQDVWGLPILYLRGGGLVDFLVEFNADRLVPTARRIGIALDHTSSRPPLLTAISRFKSNSLGARAYGIFAPNTSMELIEALLVNKADVNEIYEGRTILHSYLYGFPEKDIIRLLLAYGADVNMKDFLGCSSIWYALHIYRQVKDSEAPEEGLAIVDMLLGAGADINAADLDGNTVLTYACMESREHCVLALLNRGADVNKQNAKGRTALMYACGDRLLSIVTVLLRHGARIDIVDEIGQTARDFSGIIILDTIDAVLDRQRTQAT
ncbi:hypothetical protein AMS68_006880 [Peltaster fructicola]|uniref:Uncharacterized protein n=1 Tax=Peltaster fructicola TaxID=286661 RepID=A0A6H0Y2X7_9PEZI|nr:hypothetical protein AMS68_006880 [Peltaster fructicola]